MKKKQILNDINTAVSHIRDDVFTDIDIDMIINDDHLEYALDQYVKYNNYYEDKSKYNLKQCFKESMKKLETYYEQQEDKINILGEKHHMCKVEHEVNLHIVNEISKNYNRVNFLYFFNNMFTYFVTILLVLFVSKLAYSLSNSTVLWNLVIAIVFAAIKVVLDKNVLTPYLHKLGWLLYSKSIKRSFAYYFASLIIIKKMEMTKLRLSSEKEIINFKLKVRDIIEIILKDVSSSV